MKTSPENTSYQRFNGILRSFSLLDELSVLDSPLHRIHPAVHLACTLLYIVLLASFGRYEISRLIPYILYPAVLFTASRLPFRPVLKRAAIALPFAAGIGLANLLADREPVLVAGLLVPGGWISLSSLVLKTLLSVLAALLLASLTGMVKLSGALRLFGMPRILVLQFAMTVRYISVLVEEAMFTTLAYKLRAPGKRGIQAAHWGAVGGSLLLRTYDRARSVGQAMKLLGFNGDYHPGGIARFSVRDALYLAAWAAFFLAARFFDLTAMLGSMMGGLR